MALGEQTFWGGGKELDPTMHGEIVSIVGVTLYVSGMATLAALVCGLPLGVVLALKSFPGRRFLVAVVNTGMGLPPVVVGLVVAMLFWRSGPLGRWELIYTPTAMIVAQVIIALPMVAGVSLAALQQVDPMIELQARALGASGRQALWTLLKEARLSLLAAVMAAFGSVISEVGAVLMVGGNIKGHTRVLTTAILQETRMGRFESALTLAVVLLAFSFTVNSVFTRLQQKNVRGMPLRCWK